MTRLATCEASAGTPYAPTWMPPLASGAHWMVLAALLLTPLVLLGLLLPGHLLRCQSLNGMNCYGIICTVPLRRSLQHYLYDTTETLSVWVLSQTLLPSVSLPRRNLERTSLKLGIWQCARPPSYLPALAPKTLSSSPQTHSQGKTTHRKLHGTPPRLSPRSDNCPMMT